MKSGKSKAKIAVAAVCIILLSVGIAFALRYMKKTEKVPVTSEKTETVSEKETTAETVLTEEKSTENDSEKSDSTGTEKKTILNFPKSKDDYTPTAFEAKLFNAVNSKRKENGVPLLNWNDCLHTAAKKRSDETLTLFSHTRPDGKKPSSVLTEKDISFTLFGECLLKGTKENDEGVNLLINGLLKEKDQSDMILCSDFSYGAVAVSLDENGNVNAVILFCNP